MYFCDNSPVKNNFQSTMYYTLAELLSREEILTILRERKLKVENIDALPDEELLRIYKTFAVPLARREPKAKKSNGSINAAAPSSTSTTATLLAAHTSLKRKGADMPMEMDNMHESPEAAVEIKRPRILDAAAEIEAALSLRKTRARSPTENFLSNVTKRCRITGP